MVAHMHTRFLQLLLHTVNHYTNEPYLIMLTRVNRRFQREGLCTYCLNFFAGFETIVYRELRMCADNHTAQLSPWFLNPI